MLPNSPYGKLKITNIRQYTKQPKSNQQNARLPWFLIHRAHFVGFEMLRFLKEKKNAIPFFCISISFVSDEKCSTRSECVNLPYICVCACIFSYIRFIFRFRLLSLVGFRQFLRSVIVLTYTHERADLCTKRATLIPPILLEARYDEKTTTNPALPNYMFTQIFLAVKCKMHTHAHTYTHTHTPSTNDFKFMCKSWNEKRKRNRFSFRYNEYSDFVLLNVKHLFFGVFVLLLASILKKFAWTALFRLRYFI